MSTNTLEVGARPTAEIDAEKALVSKVAWRLMPLIMVCYLFAFFDRINFFVIFFDKLKQLPNYFYFDLFFLKKHNYLFF